MIRRKANGRTLEQSSVAALLCRPRYPGFVLTVSLSRMSSTMFTTAGVLLVLDRTGSAPLAGATAAAAVLPGAVSGPFLGAWLDVARHRRVLIVVDQLLSVIGLLAIVALAGHAPNWTVPAVAVVYSVTRPFSTGSFYSAVAELAGSELLDTASAIEASSLNLSFVVGPALAGALTGATSAATRGGGAGGDHALGRRPDRDQPGIRGQAPGAREERVASAPGWAADARAQSDSARHGRGQHARRVRLGTDGGRLSATFALRGSPSPQRVGLSYGILGLSALLWPPADTLALGILLIAFTGFVEGPAYSGTIALRQRLTPPAVRAQVMTTLTGVALVASSAGAAIGGLVHKPLPVIIAFTVINAFAALAAAKPVARSRR
jgi:MFS family permease